MRLAILAAGDYPKKAYPRYLLEQADAIICCDGALEAALKHHLNVSAVVGDMDSLPKSVAQKFQGAKVHVTEQDYNDLTKTMRYIMQTYKDIESIDILGATGKHEAHTIANLSLLMTYEKWWGFWKKGINVQIVSDYCTAFAVSGNCTLQLGEGRKVSFFCNDPSLRIKTTGLQWPLDNVEFSQWWVATLNRCTCDEISLSSNQDAEVLIITE